MEYELKTIDMNNKKFYKYRNDLIAYYEENNNIKYIYYNQLEEHKEINLRDNTKIRNINEIFDYLTEENKENIKKKYNINDEQLNNFIYNITKYNLENINLKKDILNDYNNNNKKKIVSNFNIYPSFSDNFNCNRIVYLSGPSGSGKSYISRKLINSYVNLFPENDIYIITIRSNVNDDAFKNIKNLIYLDINKLNDIDNGLFSDSLILFDDIYNITNKIVEKNVINLLNTLIEANRKIKSYIIVTSHIFRMYSKTRVILNEAHIIIFFPEFSNKYHINNYLKEFIGLDKKKINYILNDIKSRYICLKISAPRILISQNFIEFL
jgi:chromosomal replication initiation ATPase DnaA